MGRGGAGRGGAGRGFDMVCNGRRVVIFNEGLEVFGFSIMKSSFCFTDVEIITIPAKMVTPKV